MKIYVTIEEGKMIPFTDAKALDAEPIAIPYDLDTLTIGQAQEIYKALAEDEDYRNYLSGAEEELWSSTLLEYARKAVRLMALVGGFSNEAVDSLTDEEVIYFAPNFEINVLRPLFQFGLYEPRSCDGFDFEGVRYCMPVSVTDGFGGYMPMAELTAEEWAESNDLRIASSHPVEYAHFIVAILCRPEGEPYNEKTARARAEKFKALPCSLALDVFFCKFARMSTTASLTLTYLRQMVESEAQGEVETPRSDNGDNDCSTPHPIERA